MRSLRVNESSADEKCHKSSSTNKLNMKKHWLPSFPSTLTREASQSSPTNSPTLNHTPSSATLTVADHRSLRSQLHNPWPTPERYLTISNLGPEWPAKGFYSWEHIYCVAPFHTDPPPHTPPWLAEVLKRESWAGLLQLVEYLPGWKNSSSSGESIWWLTFASVLRELGRLWPYCWWLLV